MKHFNLKQLLFSILFLSINYLSAQQHQFDKNNAIDYLNTEFIKTYLEDDYLKKANNPKEDSLYQYNIRPSLENRTIDNVLSYDSLASILKENNFSTTEKKISQRINNLKAKNIEDPEKLIIAVDSLFADQSKISFPKKDSIFQELKNFYVVTYDSNIEVVQDNPEPEMVSTNEKISTYFWIALVLFVVILILLVVIIYFIIKNKELKEKNKTQQDKVSNLKSENNKLEIEKNKLIKERKILVEKIEESQKIEIIEEKPSPVVPLNVEPEFVEPEPTQEILQFYAGKPNEEMEFSNITDFPVDNISVYKFTYLDKERKTAEFEVEPANDYILRDIVNFPDNYLYRVCNKSNFNTDFQTKIITEKKGTAYLIDGIWKVKGNMDKAIIKFI